MTLHEVIKSICHQYLSAKEGDFAKNPVAEFLRGEASATVSELLNDSSLKVLGSAGKGKWADVPWIVIYNEQETGAPREGLYVDYLFSADMSRVYLAMGYGVSAPIEREGKKEAFGKIDAQILSIRANAKPNIEGLNADNKMNLASDGLGANYERATVFYKEYNCGELPANELMVADLKKLVSFYQSYVIDSSVLTMGTDFSGVKEVEEGKRVLRQHYVRERNPKIIAAAKKKVLQEKGELRCEVCNFSFKDTYGVRGEGYIEGHHETLSVSQMEDHGGTTKVEDIVLLCSNCHRMIHTKQPWLSIAELRNSIHKPQ